MIAEIIYPDGQLSILSERFVIPASELFDNASADREVGAWDRGDFEPLPSASLGHPLKTDRFDINKPRQQRLCRIDDAEFPTTAPAFSSFIRPSTR